MKEVFAKKLQVDITKPNEAWLAALTGQTHMTRVQIVNQALKEYFRSLTPPGWFTKPEADDF